MASASAVFSTAPTNRRRSSSSSSSLSGLSFSSTDASSFSCQDDENDEEQQQRSCWKILSSGSPSRSKNLVFVAAFLVLAAVSCWNDQVVISITISSAAASQQYKPNLNPTNLSTHLPNKVKPLSSPSSSFRFCSQLKVQPSHASSSSNSSNSLELLYQCAGEGYEDFAQSLRELATNQLTHSSHGQWGKRSLPLPDNVTILALGNSHLREVSKTLACQYAHVLTNIRFLHQPQLQAGWRWLRQRQLRSRDDSGDNDDLPAGSKYENSATATATLSASSDAFVLEFENGARWISLTNTVLAYSDQWYELLDRVFLSQVRGFGAESLRIDAIVLGKFTLYQEALHTNFEQIMHGEQEAYLSMWRDDEPNSNATTVSKVIDFENVAPPQLLDVASVYKSQPIVSVSMFSKNDAKNSQLRWKAYLDEVNALSNQSDVEINSHRMELNVNNVYAVNGRKYIEQVGLECGSDDKKTIGSCHEPGEEPHSTPNSTTATFRATTMFSKNDTQIRQPRDPSDMHRCAGPLGGHADLIAWDVMELLHEHIVPG